MAVISPSSIPSREEFEGTMDGLGEWGYIPVAGKHVCVEERTLEDCLEDLRWALEDPDIKAIFCVRGGYGASEVMDQLPLSLIEQADKNGMLAPGGTILVHRPEEHFMPDTIGSLHRSDQRIYGRSIVDFYKQ